MISAKRTQGPSGDEYLVARSRDATVYGSTNERVSFSIYDGHGNMIYTTARNETAATSDLNYSLMNRKTYDVWGAVRVDEGSSGSGNNGGHVVNPSTKYCANLGHQHDE